MVAVRSRRARNVWWSPRAWRNFWWGIFFTSPALLGLLTLTAYPLLASLSYSFTSYSMFRPARWIGLANYTDLFTDSIWWSSLYNTVYLLVFSVPLGLLFALGLALLLNGKRRGQTIYRTIFYLPSMVPGIAAAVVWSYMFHPQYGILNTLLQSVGINGPGWLSSPDWAKPALIIINLWGVGSVMIIFLAGLQEIPQDLQDAARVDGAGTWSRFIHITLPFLGPYVLFALVTSLIAGFQYFAPAYVLTNGEGSPAGSTLIAPLYLYQNVFRFFKIGYASAMAWVLFLMIALCTLLVFRFIGRRVYYSGAER